MSCALFACAPSESPLSLTPDAEQVAEGFAKADLNAHASEATPRVWLNVINITPEGDPYDITRFSAEYDRKLIQSINMANEEFEGRVHFQLTDYYEGAVLFGISPFNLAQYRQAFTDRNWDLVDAISQSFNQHDLKGAINIYVMDTESNAAGDSTLMGLTTVIPNASGWKDYVHQSPRLDRIYLAYDALGGGTLSHELGHFYNLPHPFETPSESKQNYGLTTTYIECVNRMGYGCYRNGYTPEQLDITSWFSHEYRDYLNDVPTESLEQYTQE